MNLPHSAVRTGVVAAFVVQFAQLASSTMQQTAVIPAVSVISVLAATRRQ